MNLSLVYSNCVALVADDSVYLEDAAEREEYINNDKGKVYVGTRRTARGRAWAFGQFDDVVLPVAIYLLEMRALAIAHPERGNPIKVVRAISAGVSSQLLMVLKCLLI